jgi:hypothetical protein
VSQPLISRPVSRDPSLTFAPPFRSSTRCYLISLHPTHELRHQRPHFNGHREMRTPRPAGFIASFKATPLEIFRVNKGPRIFLREWAAFQPQRSTIFDLHTYEGKVLPKALNKANYQCESCQYLSSYRTNVDSSAEWGLNASERAVSTVLSPTALGKRLGCLFCSQRSVITLSKNIYVASPAKV